MLDPDGNSTISYQASNFPRVTGAPMSAWVGGKLGDNVCLKRNYTIPIRVHNVLIS